MKSINLMESQIPQIFAMNMKERYGYNWWHERTGDIYNVFFSTVAAFLKRNSSKNDSTTGVCIKNADGNFIIAGVLTYTPPEEESEDKGNFSLEFVTSEDDYKALDIDHDITDYEKQIYTISERLAYDMANGRWKSVQIMWNIFSASVETLRDFIFKNLDETGEAIEVILPGVFTAMGEIEDDTKQFAIVPAGSIKQIIKSDVVL